jgi:hypothetical protein
VRAADAAGEGIGEAGPVSARHQNTVRVDIHTNGAWKVAVSQRNEPIVCATLAEARRAGYVAAVERSPCELVVRDAYHRVLAHEHLRDMG